MQAIIYMINKIRRDKNSNLKNIYVDLLSNKTASRRLVKQMDCKKILKILRECIYNKFSIIYSAEYSIFYLYILNI